MTLPHSGEVYYAEDGTVSTVLDDTYDPNYEPSASEIEEYAKFIGIDIEREKELLWLAREGLKTPMPSQWKPCKTDTGEVYYFNFETGESIWEHPLDEVYKNKAEKERVKLQAGNYQPPANATKGKKKGSEKKLTKGGAGFDDDKPSSLNDNSALAAGVSALGSLRGPGTLAPTSGATPTKGRLGTLDIASATTAVEKPDISMLLPNKAETALNSLLNKNKSAIASNGALLQNAAKETEKRIREKITAEFEQKIRLLDDKHEKQMVEAREEAARKLKNVQKNLEGELQDEKDTARRNFERLHKREIQDYEENFEEKREMQRKILKGLLEQVAEALSQLKVVSSVNFDKERAIAKAEAERKAEGEISKKREELHDAWQREKRSVEVATAQKVAQMKEKHEARVKGLESCVVEQFGNTYVKKEVEMAKNLNTVKEEIAAQKRAFVEEQQRKGCSEATTEAYRAAERRYESIVASAKEKVATAISDIKEEYSNKILRLKRDHEAKKQDIAITQSESSAEGETQVAAKKAEAARTIRARQQSLEDEIRIELREYKTETERIQAAEMSQIAAVKERDSRANAQRAQACEVIRKQMQCEEQAAVDELNSTHRREISSLESEIAEKRRATEARNASLSRELQDMILAEKARATLNVQEKLTSLNRELAEELETHLEETRRKALRDMNGRIEEYKTQTKEMLLKEESEMEARHRAEQEMALSKKNATDASIPSTGADAAVHAAEKEARTIKKILRRRRLRDELESVRRIDITKAEVIISTRVEEERRRLQRELETLTEQLAKEATRAVQEYHEKEDSQQQARLSAVRVEAANALGSRPQTPDRNRVQSFPSTPIGRPPVAHYNGQQQQFQLNSKQVYQSDNIGESGGLVSSVPNSAGNSQQNTPLKQLTQQQLPLQSQFSQRQDHGKFFINAPSTITNAIVSMSVSAPISERVAKAREVIRRRKKELKQKQEELQNARADWSMDMTAAKHNKDTVTISLLQTVKGQLERQAHALNDEARDLLAAVAWLKEQEAAEGRRRAAESAPITITTIPSFSEALTPIIAPSSSIPPELTSVLQAILAKTTDMERRIEEISAQQQQKPLRDTGQENVMPKDRIKEMGRVVDDRHHHRSSSTQKIRNSSCAKLHLNSPSGNRRTSNNNMHDPMLSKWFNWLQSTDQQQQQQPVYRDPHFTAPKRSPRLTSAPSGAPPRDINAWVTEQQHRGDTHN